MVEFRGVVNINEAGEVVCFCSKQEELRGGCHCRKKYNCPDAIISIEVIDGTRPSDAAVKNLDKVHLKAVKEVSKIKEGLANLEKSIKRTNFKFKI